MEFVMEAKVIRPTTYKGKELECEVCGITYSKRDYGILFKANKIAYFEFLDSIVCHDCFYKAVKKVGRKNKIKEVVVKLKDGRKNKVLKVKC